MNCIVVDDNDIQRELICNYIKDLKYLQLIKSCSNAREALDILKKEQIDLLFLDIEMPGMNGLDLMKTLEPQQQVIFISSHKKYATQAYDLEVTDYLVKPFDFVRFVKAVNKARKNTVKTDLALEASKESIFVKVGNDIIKIRLKDILWIESESDYIVIHILNDKFWVLTSMNEMEKKITAEKFIRIHRSYMVNIDKIEKVSGDMIVMMDKKLLPISRSHKANLIRKLNIV